MQKVTRVLFLFLIPLFFYYSLWAEHKITPQRLIDNYFRYFEVDVSLYAPSLAVDETFLYLYDKQHGIITVCSRNDGKVMASFGKKGEGPGEFDYIMDIKVDDHYIYVCTGGKLCIFNKNGKLTQEIKRSTYINHMYIPINGHYISKRYDYSNYQEGKSSLLFNLLDGQLKKEKTFFQVTFADPNQKKNKKETLYYFQECRKAEVYQDKIFLGCSDKGFYISVFDENANHLYNIEKKFPVIRVDDNHKKMINEHDQKAMGTENYNAFKTKFNHYFPEYLPAFMNFFVDKGHIYVFKYPHTGSSWAVECFLMDLKGNILKQSLVHMGRLYIYLEEKSISSFYDGKLYALTDGGDDNSLVHIVDMEAIFRDNRETLVKH